MRMSRGPSDKPGGVSTEGMSATSSAITTANPVLRCQSSRARISNGCMTYDAGGNANRCGNARTRGRGYQSWSGSLYCPSSACRCWRHHARRVDVVVRRVSCTANNGEDMTVKMHRVWSSKDATGDTDFDYLILFEGDHRTTGEETSRRWRESRVRKEVRERSILMKKAMALTSSFSIQAEVASEENEECISWWNSSYRTGLVFKGRQRSNACRICCV